MIDFEKTQNDGIRAMNHVPVFGQVFSIDFGDAEGNIALCDKQTGEITLDENIKDDGIDSVSRALLHELVHAVFFRTGLDQTSIDDDLQEVICENIANCIGESFWIIPKGRCY